MIKKIVKYLLIFLVVLYTGICIAFYFYQENLLFHPRKLESAYSIDIGRSYEETDLPVSESISINTLLIPADSSKGVVIYLHGNAGTIYDRADQAELFNRLGYDFFMPEYRGYGKSGGKIESEEVMQEDIQKAFIHISRKYDPDNIIILGYSMGTGFASRLAAKNHAKRLILLAPWYSIPYLKNLHYPIFPDFLLNYEFPNYKYLQESKMPVTIFHGDEDTLIPLENSIQLSDFFKPEDELIILPQQQHNGIPWNEEYQTKVRELINN